MTDEEFKDIQEQLERWRGTRHISIEQQKQGFKTNMQEEYNELCLAKEKFLKLRFWDVQHINTAILINDIIDAYCDMAVIAINAGYEIDENFGRYGSAGCIEDIFELIEEMGVDAYAAMNEVIRIISLRTGKWDEEQKKWIKDLEIKSYPNYMRCMRIDD
ncbi:MAG: hypothetical protein KGV43_02880 [Arcobacter sp.]|nr:hypothetical protein [Arcobacter sp.]